ncbi:hypothetical protein MHD_02775 [Mannheimia granulomatis]|uniref:Lipoprotein HlpB n=1 Tax=Mannheimia granulomatis TaxID=85402 RepID=A0A011M0Q6_9PAST|nr:hypothetical protein [Mannheimia granulomatis]EXI63078.1 hypothetical protein AK33_01350 [Mannheimia granulomatis]RGE48889.1 hypothetical protein MHD_02775 [Mannheimia granulomatis]
MNILTKVGLSALLTIFLTACEKPSSPEAQKSEQTPSQTQEKVEESKDTGAQDYKALREWQDAQEKALRDTISSATNKLNEKQKSDAALMQETVNQALLSQLENIKVSAESLNIQNAEVKALKDKTLEVLTLGTEMIVEGAKMEKNPTPEAHKAFGELQTRLNQLAEQGQQLEKALKAKYEPAPQQ